ncbi:MAG: helix-turn-helix domain-containing protein [Actinobacteria bacterium]|nr:helix-turn-helix domain-containing protein [Actinomycetota bacterium]MCL5447056.1 helix-turn-helix domain-containing protein [Actinomycetota bacterium]
MDSMVRMQARALSDRTRFSIYNTIRSSASSVTVADLTSIFKLNHNAIRQHLAILVDAGLVKEELERRRTTPGRPRLFYSTGGQESLPFGAIDPDGRLYSRLALLLAEAIDSNTAPREMGRVAGMRGAGGSGAGVGVGVGVGGATAGTGKVGTGMVGASGKISDGDQALDRVMSAMETEGFHTRLAKKGKRIELIVDTCPFINIAEVAPGVVCDLHLGMAEGVTAATSDLTVVGLKKSDPLRSGCRLLLEQATG